MKLVKILKEMVTSDTLNLGDKYISGNNLAKKLESNPNEIYDFGGGDKQIFGDKSVVIDAYDTPKNGNPDDKIHDLNKYIFLPPRKLINMGHSFYNFQFSKEIKKTVDDALKPGGYLVVQDYYNTLEKLKSIFKNYKIVYERTYEGDPDLDENDDGGYVIVFQK